MRSFFIFFIIVHFGYSDLIDRNWIPFGVKFDGKSGTEEDAKIDGSYYAAPTPAYYHDTDVQRNQGPWMKRIPDTKLLKDISIPGTHDSGSMYGGDSFQCQSLTIEKQLKSGIRVFDIRAKCKDGEIFIYHRYNYQHLTLKGVIDTIKGYLSQYPSETVLLKIKEEDGVLKNGAQWCGGDIGSQFGEKIHDNTAYSNLFWNSKGTHNPTLSEVRGKIIVLNQDFETSKPYGIPFPGTFDLQNHYHLVTNWDLYEKWELVKKQLVRANEVKSKQFYWNYLSGAVGSFPYFVASGHFTHGTDAPRLSTGLSSWSSKYPDFPRWFGSIWFWGTNPLTYEYIQKYKPKFVGIIAADFPGEGLIDEVIKCNFR